MGETQSHIICPYCEEEGYMSTTMEDQSIYSLQLPPRHFDYQSGLWVQTTPLLATYRYRCTRGHRFNTHF